MYILPGLLLPEVKVRRSYHGYQGYLYLRLRLGGVTMVTRAIST
jgi:hypothetical protein